MISHPIHTLLAVILVAGTCISAVQLDTIVTHDFFCGIINQSPANCAGRGFYTRPAFLSAAASYPEFANTAPKHEVAAFFAHVTQETGFMCHRVEQGGSSTYCDPNKREWPCVAGRNYHGRGPLQLSWNYNITMVLQDKETGSMERPAN